MTLALAADIEGIAATGKLVAQNWERPLAEQQHAVHVDDRVPGAQGQSEGHQGLGRSDQAGHLGDHAESEDFRRRALELPCGMGLGAQAARRIGRDGSGLREEAVRERARARQRRPRFDDDVRAAGLGDVLLAWENEAFLALKEFGNDKLDIVVPKVSVLAEPPVSVVDANVDRHGTRKVAEAYLEYLYSEEGQEIAARNFYRPRNPTILAKYSKTLPKIETLVTIQDFGGWTKAQARHFADKGVFDQIYATK